MHSTYEFEPQCKKSYGNPVSSFFQKSGTFMIPPSPSPSGSYGNRSPMKSNPFDQSEPALLA